MSVWPVMGRPAAPVLSAAALACVVPAQTPVSLTHQNDEYSPAAQELQKGILNRLRATLRPDTKFFGEQLEVGANTLCRPRHPCRHLCWLRSHGRFAGRADCLCWTQSVQASGRPRQSRRQSKAWFKVDVRSYCFPQPDAKKIL